jgi:hypothetical protein
MWNLDKTIARSESDALATMVQLLRPDLGLTQIRVGLAGETWRAGETTSVMRVCRGVGTPDAAVISECYVRGADLIATYEASASRAVRSQIYWRMLDADGEMAVGVEVLVSVETDLLDSDPSTIVSSALPAAQVLVLRDAAPPAFEVVDPTERGSDALVGDGIQVVLARLQGCPFSYVEMISPTDCDRSAISLDSTSSGMVRVDHVCFAERLEKGVIRRSRLRGYFVLREQDTDIANQLRVQFAESEPPLTV